MSQPLIGISTYQEEARWGVWTLPASLVPAGYPQQVQRSGGLAALLPPGDPATAAAAVARLDGLVIAGGADVQPARYGAEPHPRTGPPALDRDAWELALIEAALAGGVPLLGICRGLQLLNVALGGTLIQHLDGHAGAPGVFEQHEIKPVPGTLLGRTLPEPVAVPTYHHQAVDRIGRGLLVSAYAEDGTIEALELPGAYGFALAVQWHPEAGDDTRVMDALVAAARGESPAE
ncbi:gamma-glutamyl-gamma-aminobutyrate hydrolase family protein [Streptomyces libani]|uniref:Gamma-glutamyl-gamma-aminobutyrate hydrolase family protein n=1 Tax=Streptomyces nigrescens TaxID=1920 RepID=A0ABY7JD76_STRNI|nr:MULTISPECIES: gamma-glutamyl-gamma-aminobutyrate hydrolase family protein [Streptomyces]AWN26322.1 gamma-glutamyl-gamma-aminobutyrate hydrolase [Streptomyces sp. NEAU-S7GS2]MCX5450690.1 gamma-glutamyl-gamma-aminobutyrate hydrolase family protein [Streptomyces libani]MYT13816.1 gamma-glutamyl-gamma-aminobutyrate hydrolase family protein [Streptomyces sp. SID4951]MYX10141.1 gamma-glutamyl-gamma-aminobutyrate hydrolase family protein [Streptomyces sp. SID8375]WAU07972.1 gamma-glutamyl-gamma-am